jgi:hypothetical protein
VRLWRRKKAVVLDPSPEAQAEQYLRPGHPLWNQLIAESRLRDLGVEGFDEDGVPIGERGKDMRPHLRAIIEKEKRQ